MEKLVKTYSVIHTHTHIYDKFKVRV